MLGLSVALTLAFGGGYVAAKRYTAIHGVQQLGAGLSALQRMFGFNNPSSPSSAPTNTGEAQQ